MPNNFLQNFAEFKIDRVTTDCSLIDSGVDRGLVGNGSRLRPVVLLHFM